VRAHPTGVAPEPSGDLDRIARGVILFHQRVRASAPVGCSPRVIWIESLGGYFDSLEGACERTHLV